MADFPPAPPASPPPPPTYPPYAPPPSRPRRLTRSSHDRMWAGVAGGMAEYFEIDPSLMRLLWVAAAVVSGGLAVPVYILLWIILPRDERQQAWYTSQPTQPRSEPARETPTSPEAPTEPGYSAPPAGEDQPWWQTGNYVEPRRNRHHHHPRSTGIVLVTLGIFLLAANAGVFSWVNWHTMWPLIFIGLGLILLAKQSGWGR